jgi:hypothetical protein
LIEFGQQFLNMDEITTRIEQLEVLRQPGPVDTGDPEDAEQAQDDLFAELATCEKIVEETRGYGGDHEWRGDWYPGTFIRESDFEDYAREFAEDIHGDAIRNASWPMSHIDWTAATDSLRMDYSEIEIEGTTYLYR